MAAVAVGVVVIACAHTVSVIRGGVRVLCAGEGDIEGFESKRDAGEPVACVAWYTSSATRCS